MWRALPPSSGNVAISPPGLFCGLHLLASGAQGETQAELLTALHRPSAILADNYRKYFEDIAPVLKWTQRLYARPGLALGQKFVEEGRLRFATEVLALPDKASIDAWVSQSTSSKIPSLALGNLNDVSLLLVNCLYFQLAWNEPFEVKDTSSQPFHGKGWTHQVPTMQQIDDLLYVQAAGFRVVELTYRPGRFVFDILLPDRQDGLADLEKSLAWEQLEPILAKMEPTSIHLFLPRFQIRGPQAYQEALLAMGVRRAFKADADFVGIHPDLYLSELTQQTWLRVDEEGTQAASVTEAILVSSTPEPPLDLRADHPFLFLIRDTSTGMILFVGRVVDPEA